MRKLKNKMLMVCVALATMLAWPISAHHAVSGQYIPDDKLLETITGVVTKLHWGNPHIYFYVDVEEEGEIVTHELETFPPLFYRRHGLTKSNFAVGSVMTFDVWPARNGKETLHWIKVMHFEDGSTLATMTDDEAATAR